MSDTNDLKEIVQKAAAGDRAAFEELYKMTCRSVYFTCLGFLKEEQEARDITQDVYLAALEKLGTLEDAEKFKPWLYRIAANKSINRLKKMRPFLPGDEQLEGMKPEDNENFLPEEYALNADKRELVLKIVRETCSDVLYQTILLHYFNGFSIAEIAEIMECPEGTVKYRLSAARTKIKEGVLRYEKKSGEKLRSAGAVPFLAALFTAQMESMQMPSLPTSILDALPKSTLAASTAKTGGSILLKSLQFKIAIGIAAAVVAVGGIATAAVLINRNAKEVSVEGQEENRLEKTTPETDEETVTEDGITVEEVTSEAIEEATEPAIEPTTEPQSQYTYTDMSATMYAKSSVNVRSLPSADGERLGSLSTNQEVTVTGQCNETGWYRIEYNGAVAYVSNNYLSDTKVEVQNNASDTQAGTNDSGSGNDNRSSRRTAEVEALYNELISTYGLYRWNDFGDWFVYLGTSPDDIPGVDIGWEIRDILEERYGKYEIEPGVFYRSNGAGGAGVPLLDDMSIYAWIMRVESPCPQGLKDFIYRYGNEGCIANRYYMCVLYDRP